MTRETYHVNHYANVTGDDLASWRRRWPSFSPRELACKGDGELLVDADSLDRLQALRNHLGVPMNVTSAFRNVAYNRRVGGAAKSKHIPALAYDVSMVNHDPEAFEAAAIAHGFHGIGHYPAPNNFMHIDTRPRKANGQVTRWNKGGWFKTGATDLPKERPDPIINLPEGGALGGGGAVAVVQLAREMGIDLSGVDWNTVLMAAAVLALLYVGVKIWRRRGGEI